MQTKDWLSIGSPGMTATSLAKRILPGQPQTPIEKSGFSLSGNCPHCRRASVFVSVHEPYSEIQVSETATVTGYKSWAVLQCQGCKRFILGGVFRDLGYDRCDYLEHSPFGTPNDDVAVEIPERIANDFREALRCRWVKAWNATAEMCRRAIQSSCLEFGADCDTITAQIDYVYSKGKITSALKDIAHKIRLGGNRAAHPNESEPPISDEEADAIVEFTRHYLHHVYVVPKQLDKFDFSKAGRRGV